MYQVLIYKPHAVHHLCIYPSLEYIHGLALIVQRIRSSVCEPQVGGKISARSVLNRTYAPYPITCDGNHFLRAIAAAALCRCRHRAARESRLSHGTTSSFALEGLGQKSRSRWQLGDGSSKERSRRCPHQEQGRGQNNQRQGPGPRQRHLREATAGGVGG